MPAKYFTPALYKYFYTEFTVVYNNGYWNCGCNIPAAIRMQNELNTNIIYWN